jgi:hypothetical protein
VALDRDGDRAGVRDGLGQHERALVFRQVPRGAAPAAADGWRCRMSRRTFWRAYVLLWIGIAAAEIWLRVG